MIPMLLLRINQMCDTLKISGVEASDGGSYICTVDNDDDPQKMDISPAISLVYCSE